MTWAEVVTQIDAGMVLTATGSYVKQIENKEIDSLDSSNIFLHKGYSLRNIFAEHYQTTGLSGVASYVVELKVSYLCLTDSEHQTNIDLFYSLIKLFTNKNPFTNFAGFVEDPSITYDDNDKSTIIGLIKMNYGFKGL